MNQNRRDSHRLAGQRGRASIPVFRTLSTRRSLLGRPLASSMARDSRTSMKRDCVARACASLSKAKSSHVAALGQNTSKRAASAVRIVVYATALCVQ